MLCLGDRCFSRDWRVVDYGMCDLMDLLTEIPDTTITIVQQDSDTVISVPKRGEDSSIIIFLQESDHPPSHPYNLFEMINARIGLGVVQNPNCLPCFVS